MESGKSTHHEEDEEEAANRADRGHLVLQVGKEKALPQQQKAVEIRDKGSVLPTQTVKTTRQRHCLRRHEGSAKHKAKAVSSSP